MRPDRCLGSANHTPGVEGRFNFNDERGVLCYLNVKVANPDGTSHIKPLSQWLAGVMANSDLQNGFWWSLSNQIFNGIIGLVRNLIDRGAIFCHLLS
ncbi:MAG: phage tail sheath subtilisin-like domain-containing protein [Candidatus Pacebacteria bacterium]|nr:phage tail sheath subtilisin-like domain-containing protein [Candidatus Paceibacterota bacterium]